jgi:hypothetical protein
MARHVFVNPRRFIRSDGRLEAASPGFAPYALAWRVPAGKGRLRRERGEGQAKPHVVNTLLTDWRRGEGPRRTKAQNAPRSSEGRWIPRI